MAFILENLYSLFIVAVFTWFFLVFLALISMKTLILNPYEILKSFETQTEIQTILQYLNFVLSYNEASRLLRARNPSLTLGEIQLLLLGGPKN